jgi:hypothetical protein
MALRILQMIDRSSRMGDSRVSAAKENIRDINNERRQFPVLSAKKEESSSSGASVHFGVFTSFNHFSTSGANLTNLGYLS